MSHSWTWTYHDGHGKPISGDTASFPTQAEAEAWIGQAWVELADDGVAAVTLRHGDQVVYGPMSLASE